MSRGSCPRDLFFFKKNRTFSYHFPSIEIKGSPPVVGDEEGAPLGHVPVVGEPGEGGRELQLANHVKEELAYMDI